MRARPILAPQKTADLSMAFLAHLAGATMGKQAEVGRQTEGTRAKLGSRSLGKIQTSTAFVSRESPCTF